MIWPRMTPFEFLLGQPMLGRPRTMQDLSPEVPGGPIFLSRLRAAVRTGPPAIVSLTRGSNLVLQISIRALGEFDWRAAPDAAVCTHGLENGSTEDLDVLGFTVEQDGSVLIWDEAGR